MDLEVIESLGALEKIGMPEALAAKEEEEDVKPVNTTIAGNGFYGNRPQQPAAQDRALPSRAGPSSSSQSHAIIYPIEAISPFMNNWTIKARVTKKSDIRTWHKASGEGKLFSVDFLDESGEIKATGFNEQCDTWYDVLEEGQVYYVSHCRAAISKKQFNTTPHDYELTFERNTIIEKAEHQEDIPQIRFNFTTLADLQEIEKDSTVDVIGVLKSVEEVTQIIAKSTQKPYDKRELTIVDDTGFSIRLTIWGKSATTFEANPESVIAFKGTKVGDFGGRSLSLLSSGSMTINPDIQEAHKLKGWYDSQGRTDNFQSFSMSGAGAAGGRQDPQKTLAQVRDEGLGMSENTDYFTIKGTVVFIKQNSFAYPACLNESCNKKVTEMDGVWRCEKCDQNHDRPQYRYIIQCNVQDHTGQLYISAFDDIGRLMLGRSADDLTALKEDNPQAAEKVFEDASCKVMSFKCRAKMDTFGDMPRYVTSLYIPPCGVESGFLGASD